jgi:FkbM family methyltransferase
MPSRLRQYMVHASQVTLTELNGVAEDVRVFFQRTRHGITLRQRRLDGASLLVRAEEAVGHEIYFYGEYEPEYSNSLLAQIRETDVCVDAGANMGFYTVLMAMRARRGVVHAFEPVPLNYHILSTNVLVNELRNIVVNNFALGDHNGETEFAIARDGGLSSILDTGRGPIDSVMRVPISTLDDYVEKNGIERIDCLKADVEGAEEVILRGAPRLFSDANRRPRFLMLELENGMLGRYGSSVDRVVDLMRDYGYAAMVPRDAVLVPFTADDHKLFYNVYFIAPENKVCV